jgi:hypothetical protein
MTILFIKLFHFLLLYRSLHFSTVSQYTASRKCNETGKLMRAECSQEYDLLGGDTVQSGSQAPPFRRNLLLRNVVLTCQATREFHSRTPYYAYMNFKDFENMTIYDITGRCEMLLIKYTPILFFQIFQCISHSFLRFGKLVKL